MCFTINSVELFKNHKKNISDLNALYNDVVNAMSEFKVAYQAMSY